MTRLLPTDIRTDMWTKSIERIRSNPRHTALAALVLAFAYVVLGRLTFSVSVENSNVTSVVFAPEGIALAFCILFGPRVAWGVLVGQTILSIWSGPSVLGGAAIGLVNSLECALGAILFARWRISPQFARPRDVLLFVALVFLILQPISATGGVSVLWAIGTTPADWIPDAWQAFWIQGIQRPLADPSEIAPAWIHWWIGNSVGQMLIAPLLLAWAIRGVSRRPKSSYDLLVSALAIGLLGLAATKLTIYPLLVLGVTYPLLVWIGLRRGLRGVTTANVLIAPAITWAGAVGTGFLSHLDVSDRLAYVSFFIATASIFSLMLFAMFEERRVLVERLDDLARLDSLVPLANRRHFVESLQHELRRRTERDGPVAVVVFDVDHFKRINDEHGHAAGDSVLIAIALTCQTRLKAGGLAARIGGEEFALALPDTELSDAHRFADQLRDAIAHQHLTQDASDTLIPVTVSVGVTVARTADSIDAILTRADEALYGAKRGGRNTVVVSE
ncbi:diguanylate cyclase [Mycolicibacterium sp. YH-1]|uniref:sensor domain-containing diguanylate cyclase n=1 Tax=Mycolicibacterium sp. YH-1 TaxID=2908837 RepID=UPI001F4C1EB2|nr:diguanylate cyclase [Mycolicibacterium sp. YH-1]UNB51109.1 diguanylate cyclase [Mycolicibacterium sp. YH-1]